MNKITPYTVIKDTREQDGWTFDKTKNCQGMLVKKLDTGDYTIVGYEKLLTVERKGCIEEFAGNVFQERFERELERMLQFKYRYVILEFTMEDLIIFPMGTNIPAQKRRFMKVNGYLVLSRMLSFEMKYGVTFILAGNRGKEVTASIFKRVIENENTDVSTEQ